MKMLNPTVTVMLASHLKPQWLPHTLDSILAQTRLDLQVIVCDSGDWIPHEPVGASGPMGMIHERYSRHPLVDWVTLAEPPRLIDRACPYGYKWNRIIEAGLIRGRYLSVFTDDDLYHPTFVERMAGYLDEHPEARAVWCSQDRARVDDTGSAAPDPMTIMALGERHPGQWLDQVDMTQVMFHVSLLAVLGPPWFSEDPSDQVCRHADGLFLERLGQLIGPVPAVPDVLVTHRYTPVSTYN